MPIEWIESLSFALLDAALRATILVVLVAIILRAARVASAVQHVAWTSVVCAMLLMPVLSRMVPPVAVSTPSFAPDLARVIETVATLEEPRSSRPAVVAAPRSEATLPAANARAVQPAAPAAPRVRLWPTVVLFIYFGGVAVGLARLVAGWRATARIARGCSRSSRASSVYESAVLAAPATIGVFVPRIVLPSEWRSWPQQKLDAVLAHERAHVARRDPLVAFLAHLNRCVFWFHPVAWWVERKLATLAEHACDEAAVRATGERECYAEVLLDIAMSVRQQGGRLASPGIGVGGNGMLGRRIDRILSAANNERPSAAAKTLVAIACASTIVLVIACRQEPTPLRENPEYSANRVRQKAEREFTEAAQKLTPEQVAALEAAWKQNPEDLTTLKKILIYYGHDFSGKDPRDQARVADARRPYILWLIEHHPEHDLAGSWPARIFPTTRDFLADPTGYEEAKQLWLAQAARADVTVPALANAARFFEAHDKPLAEQMVLRAQAIQPSADLSSQLGRLYALIVVGSNASMPLNVLRSVDPNDAAGPYAQEIRQKLASATDSRLLLAAGQYLIQTEQFFRYGKIDIGFDPVALGKSSLERAVELDPNNGAAKHVLAWRKGVEEHNRLWDRLKGIPAERQPEVIAQMPEADRFVIYPEVALNSYYTADVRSHKQDAEGMKVATARSKQYALDALALAEKFRDHPNYGVVIYRANLALATHTLREGDQQAAVRYMLAAAKAPASEGFIGVNIGMDLRLVNYLLKYGERESVIEFLEHSAALRPNDRERLLKDAADIRGGMMPMSYQAMVARGE